MQTLCRPCAGALTSSVNVAISEQELKCLHGSPRTFGVLVTVIGGNTIPPRDPNDDDDEDEDDEEDEDRDEEPAVVREPEE